MDLQHATRRQLDYLRRQFVIKIELFHPFKLNFKLSLRINIYMKLNEVNNILKYFTTFQD